MNDLLEVKNPYTLKTIQEIEFLEKNDIHSKIDLAQKASLEWKNSATKLRADVLKEASELLKIRKNEFAKLICQEAGKPISLAEAEVGRAIETLQWSAEEALRFSGELINLDATSNGRKGFGLHQKFPKGILFGITPFNFPLNLMVHKVGPAIASGNVIIIKPSPLTPLVCLKTLELFPNLPKGVLQVLILKDQDASLVTTSKKISAVSFTGSAKIGWKIKKQAYDKSVFLELGGNAWSIIDQDISKEVFERITERILQGAFAYAGQSCISVQNLAIHQSQWKNFEPLLKEKTQKFPFGNPESRKSLCGPVIHLEAKNRLNQLLRKDQDSAQSKNLISESSYLEALLPPEIVFYKTLSELIKDNARSQEEMFGPFMNAVPYQSTEELIQCINQSPYGLQAGIFTQNLKQIMRLYQDLNIGGLVINDIPTSRYEHQPYGGVKNSGLGREGIRYAMEDFCESKFLALSTIIP